MGTWIKNFLDGLAIRVFWFIIFVIFCMIFEPFNAKASEYSWDDFRVMHNGKLVTLDEAGFDEIDIIKPLKDEIAELKAEIERKNKRIEKLRVKAFPPKKEVVDSRSAESKKMFEYGINIAACGVYAIHTNNNVIDSKLAALTQVFSVIITQPEYNWITTKELEKETIRRSNSYNNQGRLNWAKQNCQSLGLL